ncbi:MAG: tryptophan 7-halogenase [Caulobacteraceae bacterium]|nr:tryptophan 7-halogenase [Caulobacter sp.]
MAERAPKTRVVICGGGTAGWLAAAALSKQLGPLLEVTLVESEAIGTVGVGESTIPTVRTFHALAGVDERDFLRAARATFKLGISFEDWGAVGERYIHSFGEIGRSTWMGGFQHMWLQARDDGLQAPLDDYCFELRAARENRFATGEKARINFAYHLDAVAYAAFLRQLSEARGVVRVEGRIAEVRHAAGLIEAVRLEDGRELAGDLFIDCTGFSALLIGKALGAGYEDWSPWLATDSAVALQTAATEPARPYTRAIAHRAGWRWKIPLQHRVGNGLVYQRAEMSDDEAHALLLSSVEGERLSEPRVIRYRAGRREDAWRGNCVALGLSSGFVEPLESTAIHLIMISVTRLIQLFPFGGSTPAVRARYNALAQQELERIRDFVVLHYHLTRRDDSPFWDRMRTMDAPETLRARMELFRETAHAYQGEGDLFRPDSWVQVLLGQGLAPEGRHRMGALLQPQQMRQALADLKRNIGEAVARLPQHQAFLDRYLAAA